MLVTGSGGFIGKNLCSRLVELGFEIRRFERHNNEDELREFCSEVDFVVHLAGVNRPKSEDEFATDNADFTETLCRILESIRLNESPPKPVLFSSSIQVGNGGPYAESKAAAEDYLRKYSHLTGASVEIIRLPNVFGKWARPNYNSVVATFCFNIANDLPIRIDNPDRHLSLSHVDDVVNTLLSKIQGVDPAEESFAISEIEGTFDISVSDLSTTLLSFRDNLKSNSRPNTESPLIDKLFSTYVSYLPPGFLSTPVASNVDERGVFAELLKTNGSGQFSFVTCEPGATRGDHYHHSKFETFFVISGEIDFSFRHLLTGETFHCSTSSSRLEAVTASPGWVHSLTNNTGRVASLLVWANEVFDSEHPDTFSTEKIQGK